MQMELPIAVQKHIMSHLLEGKNVEIWLSDGEFKVFTFTKKSKRFPITSKMYNGNSSKEK